MNGKVLRVPSHPPEFTQIPWNQLTVRVVAPVNGFFTDLMVTNAIVTQLGLTANQRIAWRLHSVRFWARLLATPPLGSAAIRVFSLVPEVAGSGSTTTTNHPTLEEIRDYPDQVRRASVGFEWPVSQQSISISGTALPSFSIFNLLSGGGADSLIYFRLWWRPTFG